MNNGTDEAFIEPMVDAPADLLRLTAGEMQTPEPLVQYIRSRPYEATLLTLAAGMALGLMLGLRR